MRNGFLKSLFSYNEPLLGEGLMINWSCPFIILVIYRLLLIGGTQKTAMTFGLEISALKLNCLITFQLSGKLLHDRY